MSWFSEFLHRIFGPRPAPGPGPDPSPPPPAEVITRALAEHNHLRAVQGIYLYRNSPALNQIAQGHANYMARHGLDHYEPGSDPFQRIRSAGYPVGSENIAWNYSTPESVSVGWTGDAGHRANVLSRQWTEVGFGMARNVKGEPYWCADYGAKIAPPGFQAAPLPGGIRGPGLTNS